MPRVTCLKWSVYVSALLDPTGTSPRDDVSWSHTSHQRRGSSCCFLPSPSLYLVTCFCCSPSATSASPSSYWAELADRGFHKHQSWLKEGTRSRKPGAGRNLPFKQQQVIRFSRNLLKAWASQGNNRRFRPKTQLGYCFALVWVVSFWGQSFPLGQRRQKLLCLRLSGGFHPLKNIVQSYFFNKASQLGNLLLVQVITTDFPSRNHLTGGSRAFDPLLLFQMAGQMFHAICHWCKWITWYSLIQ